MAYQSGNTVRNINNGPTENKTWKNDAYVNMSLPIRRKDGTKTTEKMGALELKLSKDTQARVIAAFREDPDGAAERLRAALIFNFNEVGANEEAEVLF